MQPHSPGLTTWLAVVTVLLVSIAVTALSFAAIGSLRELAETEGLTRVELAVSAAREGLRQSIEDSLTGARVLAQRPTLQNLLQDGNAALVAPYLNQYCEAADLDGCAITLGPDLFVAVGRLPVAGGVPNADIPGESFIAPVPDGSGFLYGASTAIRNISGARVIVARRIDDIFASRLSERAGLDIRISSSVMHDEQAPDLAAIDAEALARQLPVTGFLTDNETYVASLAVATLSADHWMLLRAFLPSREVLEPVQALSRRMLTISIVVAALAALSGIMLGRRWISVVSRLTAAASRIGSGDLALAVPAERGKELGVLAATMEQMRLNLLELESARRTRDTVLANISHEFRTPLTAQLASIELLQDGLGSIPFAQQRELVDSLERGAQRLSRLIDNLLESVRIESGQLAIRRQEVDLADIVAAARDLIEPLIRQRRQLIEVSLPDLPAITGDRQRLIQVVVNLLANANKFAPPGSAIRIGAEARGNGIAFWVEDAGPGPAIAGDMTLFEQFRRGPDGDPEESGLGLGLFIVRSIVERHGGRVSLLRPGDRTRAQVELPGDAGK